MKKIYCVEDDQNIKELIEYTLKQTGFDVVGFECASTFFKALESTPLPDLVILDIMLPDKDGLEILADLKKNKLYAHLPVIFLTAKSGQLDTVKGLDSGADDYITKPFDILELVSRINAVLRRMPKNISSSILSLGDIEIDSVRRIVTANSTPVNLTYKEFELLYYLISNKSVVLTRDQIMNEVWGTDFEGETRTVDVHIRTLRQKLGASGECIKTVRNVGYKVD